MRAHFRHVIDDGPITARQLVCLDEAGKRSSDFVRRFGRAVRGERAYVYHHHPLGRGQSASLIASFSIEGFRTVTVINTRNETVNTDKFMEVLENEILPDCNYS